MTPQPVFLLEKFNGQRSLASYSPRSCKESSIVMHAHNVSFCCSVTQSCPAPCNPMDYSTPGFPVLHHLPELVQSHVHWDGDAIQPSHPVIPFSSCLQTSPASKSFPMSQLFPSSGQSIGASASSSVLPMNIPLNISFRSDWFDLLAVQGTLKSLLQHHSSKASILWFSAFFIVQFSHLYMTTGKTIVVTIHIGLHTFLDKVVLLLFNILPRFVIAFLSMFPHIILYLWKRKVFEMLWPDV